MPERELTLGSFSIFDVSAVNHAVDGPRLEADAPTFPSDTVRPGVFEVRIGMVGWFWEKTEDGRWFRIDGCPT